VPSDALSQLRNLEHLNLNDNAISALRKEAFLGLSKVRGGNNEALIAFTLRSIGEQVNFVQQQNSSRGRQRLRRPLEVSTWTFCAHSTNANRSFYLLSLFFSPLSFVSLFSLRCSPRSTFVSSPFCRRSAPHFFFTAPHSQFDPPPNDTKVARGSVFAKNGEGSLRISPFAALYCSSVRINHHSQRLQRAHFFASTRIFPRHFRFREEGRVSFHLHSRRESGRERAFRYMCVRISAFSPGE